MKILRIVILAMAIVLAPIVGAAAPAWEAVIATEAIADTTAEEPIEVSVRDGVIYLTTDRPVTVKMFTILGQLISQQNLSAGTHRLRMPARGIYILKAGSVTKRVTI